MFNKAELFELAKAAINKPLEVSTIFPTSSYLANFLLDQMNPELKGSIAELGPGSGAITRHLRPRLHDPKDYFGLEVNEEMVSFLSEKFPNLKFLNAKADDILKYSEPGQLSHVISSLPWTVFPSEMRRKTLKEIHHALQPKGRFLTYMCLNAAIYPQAHQFFKEINGLFSKVEKTKVEWRNIPPAFVYICTK